MIFVAHRRSVFPRKAINDRRGAASCTAGDRCRDRANRLIRNARSMMRLDWLPVEPKLLLGDTREHLSVALQVVLEKHSNLWPQELSCVERLVPLQLEVLKRIISKDSNQSHRREGAVGGERIGLVKGGHERIYCHG